MANRHPYSVSPKPSSGAFAREREIGDIVERNISLLNTMGSGQYGNVQDLQTKLRQNRFYAREVEASLRELDQVDAFVQHVQDGAIGDTLANVRRQVIRRLRAPLLSWSGRLKDAQAVISRRLFEARLMDKRLRQLARYSSWLAGNALETGHKRWPTPPQRMMGIIE